jgi:uncharacterized membrane protein (GlpM family)
MKKVIAWFVFSSANKDKYSRTIKAGLTALAPTIIFLLAYFFGIQVTEESFAVVVGNVVELVGAVLTALYFVAKIYNSITEWTKPV